MNEPRKRLSEWWGSVPAERKRIILIGGALLTLLAVSSIFNKREHSPATDTKKTEAKLDMNVVTAQRKEEGVPELRAQVDTIAQQLKAEQVKAAEMRDEMRILRDSSKDRENARVTELERDLKGTQEEVRSYRSDVLGGDKSPKMTLPPLPDQADINAPKIPEIKRPTIAVHGARSPVANKDSASAVTTSDGKSSAVLQPPGNGPVVIGGTQLDGKVGGNNQTASEKALQFLPAGTMFSGVLLNGIDAPTSSVAQKNPVPALMRIKSLAFLPNHVTQDIRECFIILSGFGVLSSERAKMRTESISCIRNDGGVIEAPIDGFAVGDDGKEGISGTLVTKQGSLIARSLVTGVLGGLASAMTPSYTPGLNVSGGGSYNTPDLAQVASAGAMGGIRTSTNEVSRFYLETAKEMHPVIEIPSETEVTVVLVKGASLALASLKPRSSSSSFFGRR